MSMKSSHDIITTCVYTIHKDMKVEYYLVWQPTGGYIRYLYLNYQLGNDDKEEHVLFNGTGL
jgi:hypothetical protein